MQGKNCLGHFSSIFLRITLQKRRYKRLPCTIGCASLRAFHRYIQIRRSPLGLAAKLFLVCPFLMANPAVLMQNEIVIIIKFCILHPSTHEFIIRIRLQLLSQTSLEIHSPRRNSLLHFQSERIMFNIFST